MRPLFRDDTPFWLRAGVATFAVLTAWFLWGIIMMGYRAPTFVTVTFGVVMLVAAFLTVGVLGTPRQRLLPLHVCLLVVLWYSTAMLAGVLTAGTRVAPNAAFLWSVLVSAGGVAAFAQRRPRVAAWFLVPLAILALYMVIVPPLAAWSMGSAYPKGAGHALAIVGAASLSAIWHARVLRANR